MEAQEIAVRLGVAVVSGSVIGFERQWLQRMAGLRTNSLVAIGAAGFVVFSSMVSGDDSPTRMAAQVVSGVGFLGAGVILREGINVTGLNTAATLWCSAMVGTFAGAGQLAASGIAAGFVVLTNLLLRPLVRLINRQPHGAAEIETHYSVELRCQGRPGGAHPRAAAAGCLGRRPRPAPSDQRKSRRLPASHGQRPPRLSGPQRRRSRTDHRSHQPRAVCHRGALAGRARGGRELTRATAQNSPGPRRKA
jgi:putative Mg2+ transporter-C (MgtC) family protein